MSIGHNPRESSPPLFDIGEPKAQAVAEESAEDKKRAKLAKKARDKALQDDIVKSQPPLPFSPLSAAVFSRARTYRYSLWRKWSESGPKVLFVGLNPSTADEDTNDRTVERLERFSRAWGYAELYVANLFAFIATDPKKLRWASNPVGPENDAYILNLFSKVDLCVLCWGVGGAYLQRNQKVYDLLKSQITGPEIKCFGLTSHGSPKHPLYLAKTTKLEEI